MTAAMSARVLAAVVFALAFPALARPCAYLHGRALAQQPLNASMGAPAAFDNPAELQVGGLTTVSVSVVEQQCTVEAGAYIPLISADSAELRSALGNAEPTPEACCSSCQRHEGCNAWQWCPLAGGCPFAGGGADVQAAAFPHQGCQLMRIVGFPPYVISPRSNSSSLAGVEVPFVAGASVNLTMAQLPNYTLAAGAGLPPAFDYLCEGTVDPARRKCSHEGGAAALAARCSGDPLCVGFTFYPRGIDYGGITQVGTLKRSPSGGDVVDTSVTTLNPAAALYMKTARVRAAGTVGGGSGVVVVAAVSSLLGAVLLGVAGAGAWLVRRKRLLRAFPEPHKDADTTGRADTESAGSGSDPAWAVSGSSKGDGRRSPPSVIASSQGDSAPLRPLMLHAARGLGQVSVSVSEVRPGAGAPGSFGGAAPPGGSGPGSAGGTTRELLEVFSRMYKQQPAVDYHRLAGVLEGGDAAGKGSGAAAAAAAVQQAALEEEKRQRAADMGPGALAVSPEQVEMSRRPDGTLWLLGTGAFGTVYKGAYCAAPGQSSRPVAVKIMHRPEEPRRAEEFVREAAMLRSLRDPHVVQFLGACLDGPQGTSMLVTELMELGDLWRALPAHSPSSGERLFAWQRRGRRVMTDVARGLAYLHSKRVVHLDLKSANILLSRTGAAKIADVGMARVLNKSCLSALSGMGTFAWSAPEVLAGRRCTEKVDVYSWGVVLWEVCTGEAPVRGDMRALRVPEECPPEVAELYRRCVEEEPQARPTAAEVVQALDALGGAA